MKYAFGENLGLGLFDNYHVHVAVKPGGAALIYVRLWDHALTYPVPEKYLGIDIAANGTIVSMGIVDPGQIDLQLDPIYDNLQSIGLDDDIVETVNLFNPWYNMLTDPNGVETVINGIIWHVSPVLRNAMLLIDSDPTIAFQGLCGFCRLMPKQDI